MQDSARWRCIVSTESPTLYGCLNCGAKVLADLGFCSKTCLLAYSQRWDIPEHLRARYLAEMEDHAD